MNRNVLALLFENKQIVKAIIIGSGVSALAASIRLAKKGVEVDVFEANEKVGGKLWAFTQDGYRFDGGPSLFTMPQYVQELIELGQIDTGFEFKKVEVACHYFWPSGLSLTGYSDPKLFAHECFEKLGVPDSRVLRYFDHIKNIYAHSGKIFLEQSLHDPSTWLSKATLESLWKIGQFDLLKSMHEANTKRLNEPHLVQLFDRFATYNGSNPYKAPGILNVIPWLEHGFGTFFPKGGMSSIPQALEKTAKSLGVKFHLGHLVKEISVENGKATGITAVDNNKSAFHQSADIIISNSDVYYTYTELLPKSNPPQRHLTQERSGSAVVFYWGIKQRFDQLGLHNILFSQNYRDEFDALFERQELPEDPTIYINISSKEETNDAPEGCENWFVMINAPAHTGEDWNQKVMALRSRVIKKINATLNTSIESFIETERTWTPDGIESDTRSYQGALYGTSSNDSLAAFLRHPNFSKSVKSLFFCGGSVHPGGGIPLALLSAKITEEMIEKYAVE